MINPAYLTVEEYGKLLFAAVKAHETEGTVPRRWHPDDIGAVFESANASIMASLSELVILRSTQ